MNNKRLAIKPFQIGAFVLLFLCSLMHLGAQVICYSDVNTTAPSFNINTGYGDPNNPITWTHDVPAGILNSVVSVGLYIEAYDVDYPSATEQDRVYFNGVDLGLLEGINNTWITMEKNVPLSAVQEGVNTLQVYVDELNAGWVTEIRYSELRFYCTNADPDFSIGVDPTTRTITQGASTDYTISLTALNGFSSPVSLSVSGLPADATPSFTVNPITPTGQTTLNITTLSTVATGTYTLTITAQGGGKTHNSTVTLTINPLPGFSISGTVTDGTNPIQGVTITFSHNGHTEITDTNGNYSYTVPGGTTTTITPSHAGYSMWNPVNRTLNSISGNMPNQDFQGTINNYLISGTLTDGTNPIQGVTITFSHNGHTETTDASGNYSYAVPFGTTTTITPNHAGYSGWNPVNRTVNSISTNMPNQDFQGAINSYIISGTITDGTDPIQGVTITFSHDGHTETTDASGNYSYTIPFGTTTTITPSHAGYSVWNPVNRTVNSIAANMPNQDFQGAINSYTISGTVTDGTDPIQGVTITFSHDGHTETTDASGNYSYTVPFGTTTTITPSHAGYSVWNPVNRTVNSIAANMPNQDFQGAINSYTISGTVTDGTDPIQGVTITFSHDGHTETTDASGNYSYTVPFGANTTITPSHAKYSGWNPVNRKVNNISANTLNQDFASLQSICVTITEPHDGDTISGNVVITATPSPGISITRVEFYIDGILFKKDTREPYQCRWDSTLVTNGSHKILVKTYQSESVCCDKEITVIVANCNTHPHIELNRTHLNFGAIIGESQTSTQNFLIENSCGCVLDWTASVSEPWIQVSPVKGKANHMIAEVSVDVSDLGKGNYMGTITITDPIADNSPKTVTVYLEVKEKAREVPPSGCMDSPQEGSTVSGSVPFTGWAVDDVEVMHVQIYRDPIPGHETGGRIYIGDAAFVEGARPDVEAKYLTYPKNYQLGWGYMMLTYFLPFQGNGTFVITAIAIDSSGNEVTIGSTTITCDNANAVKPFGTIDTPTQGEAASGTEYVNFGWALTPQPNTIPTDGSTIRLWVDGVALPGHPVYNNYRADIANNFPNYNNSNGAGGYYKLDTTMYANGVHTIAWSVKDNAGNEEGIGSRFFRILNVDNIYSTSSISHFKPSLSDITPSYSPVYLKKGYSKTTVQDNEIDQDMNVLYPEDDGIIHIRIKQNERLVLWIENDRLTPLAFSTTGSREENGRYFGNMVVGGKLKSLPIGSTLDSSKGIFYWQPGTGFVGKYRFVFVEQSGQGQFTKKLVNVEIKPGH